MAHLRGLELNQTNAKTTLKVLCIEQLGLPSWIRTSVSLPTTYYAALVNGSRPSFWLLSYIGGRSPAPCFLAPYLASRCGVIRRKRSPIVLHAGLARRAGAPCCVNGLALLSSQKSAAASPRPPDALSHLLACHLCQLWHPV
jgi:hypothetical protein